MPPARTISSKPNIMVSEGRVSGSKGSCECSQLGASIHSYYCSNSPCFPACAELLELYMVRAFVTEVTLRSCD